MDEFKKTNNKLATSLDYNCKFYTSRGRSNDGRMLSRYSRRKLKNITNYGVLHEY